MRLTVQGWPSQVRRFGIPGDEGILSRLEELIAIDNLFQRDLEDAIRKVLAERIRIEREDIAKSRNIPVLQLNSLKIDVARDIIISFDHGIMATRPTHPVISLECLSYSTAELFRRWERPMNIRLKNALCERLLPLFNTRGGSHAVTVLSKDIEESPEWNAATRSVK